MCDLQEGPAWRQGSAKQPLPSFQNPQRGILRLPVVVGGPAGVGTVAAGEVGVPEVTDPSLPPRAHLRMELVVRPQVQPRFCVSPHVEPARPTLLVAT